MLKVCKNCLGEYMGHRSSYCSSICVQEGGKKLGAELHKRQYKSAPKTILTNCPVCNGAFYRSSTNHNKVYCSKECRGQLSDFKFLMSRPDLLDRLPNRKAWLKLRILVLNRDNFSCKYCGRSPMNENGVLLHVDHKIPRIEGGTDVMDNLITACQQCNLGKQDILLDFWKLGKNFSVLLTR